jgi:RHS repeat-associated protein
MVAEQESVERNFSRYIRNQRQGAFVPCLWFLLPHDDRLSKTGNGQATGTYGYQAGTHWLTSIGSQARRYDNAGNTTGNSAAGETWGYGYDGKNRMTVVQRDGSTVATYAYNAFGERIAKAVTQPQTNNERFVYNEASQLIAELGSTNKDYIWLGDLPIGVVDTVGGTSAINYVTADGLNTPRAIADKSGRTIWTWSVVGNPLGEQPPTSTTGYVYNPRFPGQYFDQETGFNYNVFRSFDPTTGRYTQVDPMGFAGGQPGLYPYGNNNPLMYADSLGLEVGAPGTAESFIPVWGSGRQAINDFQTGHPYSGTFNAALAVSDVFLVKAATQAICKGAWKVGSNSWSATRAWYGRTRDLPKGTQVHHWAIEQNSSFGKKVPNWLKNQPWNLNPMSSQSMHISVHGKGRNPYNSVESWWYGTPDWAKIFEFDAVGKGANAWLNGEN